MAATRTGGFLQHNEDVGVQKKEDPVTPPTPPRRAAAAFARRRLVELTHVLALTAALVLTAILAIPQSAPVRLPSPPLIWIVTRWAKAIQ